MLLRVLRFENFFNHQENCFEKNHTSTIITNPCKKHKKNTLIHFQWIRSNWWSETNEGVEFADATPVQPSKTNVFVQQFHFRSNTVKAVQTYIQDCWEKCITLDCVKIPVFQIKTFKISGDPDILKLHDLKHFENLLQNKYQENEKICLNTANTQKKPQLLIPTNGNKNTLQEIKKKYFPKRGTNVTEIPKHCRIQPLENQEEFAKSVSVTSTPAVLKTSTIATEKTILSFNQKPVEYSKSSKMLVKIFGEQDFITKYAKHRKELKKNKKT